MKKILTLATTFLLVQSCHNRMGQKTTYYKKLMPDKTPITLVESGDKFEYKLKNESKYYKSKVESINKKIANIGAIRPKIVFLNHHLTNFMKDLEIKPHALFNISYYRDELIDNRETYKGLYSCKNEEETYLNKKKLSFYNKLFSLSLKEQGCYLVNSEENKVTKSSTSFVAKKKNKSDINTSSSTYLNIGSIGSDEALEMLKMSETSLVVVDNFYKANVPNIIENLKKHNLDYIEVDINNVIDAFVLVDTFGKKYGDSYNVGQFYENFNELFNYIKDSKEELKKLDFNKIGFLYTRKGQKDFEYYSKTPNSLLFKFLARQLEMDASSFNKKLLSGKNIGSQIEDLKISKSEIASNNKYNKFIVSYSPFLAETDYENQAYKDKISNVYLVNETSWVNQNLKKDLEKVINSLI